jgi:hypothetical protein
VSLSRVFCILLQIIIFYAGLIRYHLIRNYVRPDGTPSKLLEPILIGMTGQDEHVRQGGIYLFINRMDGFGSALI